MALRLGDTAPDFTQDSTEGPLHFYDWAGDSWVVLFSHPKDYTPVCTTELGLVAKLKPEFDKRGAKVIGLSVDPADIVQRRHVVESLEALVDELEAEVEPAADAPKILAIGGRTELDGAAARIVAARLQREGVPARVLPPLAIRAEVIGQLETAGINSVCLVYLGAGSRTYARFVARRLRRQLLFVDGFGVLVLVAPFPDGFRNFQTQRCNDVGCEIADALPMLGRNCNRRAEAK